jgi:hypothetical protein
LIRGVTKELWIPPKVVKDLDPKESLLPAQIDMRNLRMTTAGNVVKRNGYAEKWDISNDVPVNQLIPEGDGYAIDNDGTVYRLGETVNTLDHSVSAVSRPTWALWDKNIYVYSGGLPIKITPTNTESLTAVPYRSKFVAVIGTYFLISGHNDTEFRWSVPNNPESYVIANGAGFANIEKVGTIQNMIAYKKRLLLFTERNIEVRNFAGGSAPFPINNALHVNKGLGAPYSVVKASDDKVYWFGNDNDFYVMDNFNVGNISNSSYKRELETMQNPSELVGFDIPKEKHIKWVNQVDGKTYIYDYRHGLFYEDNLWRGSGWQAFPMNSYMELDGKQYFGDLGYVGKIWQIHEDNKDDNGSEIRAFRRFAVQPSERGNKVRVNRILIRRKGGVGDLTHTAPIVGIRYRWDKKGDWVISPNKSLGAIGNNDPYIDIRNFGIGRELEFELVETDPVSFLMTNMLITYEELRH